MTLEDLLECSSEKLASMSDAELEKHFAPYLNITRPDRDSAIHKTSKPVKQKQMSEAEQMLMALPADKRAALMKAAEEQGLNLEELL